MTTTHFFVNCTLYTLYTVKWCKESIDMVHIIRTLWVFSVHLLVPIKNLCFVVNWFYTLLRFNGTSKSSLTSKPSLTIALKILKTIEKPLKPMVGPSKNIQWWWSNVVKTIEKPLTSMVAWKKTLTIPSLWKIDHRCGLICIIIIIITTIVLLIIIKAWLGS